MSTARPLLRQRSWLHHGASCPCPNQFGSSREISHSQKVSWSPANILQHLLRDTSIQSPFHVLPCFLMALLIALEAKSISRAAHLSLTPVLSPSTRDPSERENPALRVLHPPFPVIPDLRKKKPSGCPGQRTAHAWGSCQPDPRHPDLACHVGTLTPRQHRWWVSS